MVRVRVRVALDGEDEDGALLMVDGPPGWLGLGLGSGLGLSVVG